MEFFSFFLLLLHVGEISFAEFTDRLDDLKVPKTVPGSEISTPKEQTASGKFHVRATYLIAFLIWNVSHVG